MRIQRTRGNVGANDNGPGEDGDGQDGEGTAVEPSEGTSNDAGSSMGSPSPPSSSSESSDSSDSDSDLSDIHVPFRPEQQPHTSGPGPNLVPPCRSAGLIRIPARLTAQPTSGASHGPYIDAIRRGIARFEARQRVFAAQRAAMFITIAQQRVTAAEGLLTRRIQNVRALRVGASTETRVASRPAYSAPEARLRARAAEALNRARAAQACARAHVARARERARAAADALTQAAYTRQRVALLEAAADTDSPILEGPLYMANFVPHDGLDGEFREVFYPVEPVSPVRAAAPISIIAAPVAAYASTPTMSTPLPAYLAAAPAATSATLSPTSSTPHDRLSKRSSPTGVEAGPSKKARRD